MSTSHNSIHTMVRTMTTACAHFESQPILKEPVGIVNVMDEITNLHHPPKKKTKENENKQQQKTNNKKRNDLKAIFAYFF